MQVNNPDCLMTTITSVRVKNRIWKIMSSRDYSPLSRCRLKQQRFLTVEPALILRWRHQPVPAVSQRMAHGWRHPVADTTARTTTSCPTCLIIPLDLNVMSISYQVGMVAVAAFPYSLINPTLSTIYVCSP